METSYYSIISHNEPRFSEKMAAFDYDWTLVCPITGETFPREINDWKFLHSNVYSKISELYNNGYMIVIFTNQSKKWKEQQIRNVIQELNIPMFVVIAKDKNMYKPNIDLFQCFMNFVNKTKINKEESFFVGDALGRICDYSDSDKVFSENIGIKCLEPLEIFYNSNDNVILTNNEEYPELFYFISKCQKNKTPLAITMVGYPGSGKSTMANKICEMFENFENIERDIYKTPTKMVEFAKRLNDEDIIKKNVIFNATNSNVSNRQPFIIFGMSNSYISICVYMNTSLLESKKRNIAREDKNKVPTIAFNVYKKHFEEPVLVEGFNNIFIINEYGYEIEEIEIKT